MWQTFNEILNNRKSQGKISLSNSSDAKDYDDTANTLNEYFSTVGRTLAAALPSPTQTHSPSLPINPAKSMFFSPVCSEEVLAEITSLNSKKSNDPYDIPVSLVKLSKKIIAPYLSDIFNHCILEGIFPEKLKLAKVIPVYKADLEVSHPTIDPYPFYHIF